MNLYALLDEVAASSASTDPRVLAKEIAHRIPARERLEALEEALVQFVRAHTGLRSAAPIWHSEASQTTAGRSRKLDAYTQLHRLLHARISIGGGEHKFLGDMTATDLDAGARLREEHASATLENAKKLRALAERLTDLQVDVVRDLPETEILAVWS